MDGKHAELKEKAAQFVSVRASLSQAARFPVVIAHAPTRTRVEALNARAAKIQTIIEQIGKMIDGARRWFADTFSVDVADKVPIAGDVIETMIQSAIASMNYFIRDASAELSRIAESQKIFDAADDEQKKKMLADLRARSGPVISPPSKKTALIVAAAIAVLWFVNQRRTIEVDE